MRGKLSAGIAAHLVISTKTVVYHVSTALAKLGVRTRQPAAEAMLAATASPPPR
ncbi:MAG: LuxR C-terminal-related transcriptional regulator [Streptosporangiaceae bacterium]